MTDEGCAGGPARRRQAFRYFAAAAPLAMPISHFAFRALPLARQFDLIWTEGTFLLTRYEGVDAVHLYHMPGGFFAEAHYNQVARSFYTASTFTSIHYLDDYYTRYVQLPPDLWGC